VRDDNRGMKSQLHDVEYKGRSYQALMFWCPGCEILHEGERQAGAHMLPVSGDASERPVWTWDGNLEAPTLSPSILTRRRFAGEPEQICHSYLRAGVFEFLGDCTHALAGHHVPIPDLPEWLVQ
jgi:hypothetical protein